MNNNVISPKVMNVIFKRIDFPIQKGLAAPQFVVRLPFIHSYVIILYLLI
jgi:hypothetical protein